MATSEWIGPPPRSTPCVLPPDTSLFSSCLAPPERLAYRIRSMCGTVPSAFAARPARPQAGGGEGCHFDCNASMREAGQGWHGWRSLRPSTLATRPACTRAWGVLVCSYISYITPSYQIGSTVSETRAGVNGRCVKFSSCPHSFGINNHGSGIGFRPLATIVRSMFNGF